MPRLPLTAIILPLSLTIWQAAHLHPSKPKYGDPDYYTYNEGESL